MRRKLKRTCWVYCPKCRRDLNGDNASFVEDTNDTGTSRYTCATCGMNSEWIWDTPVPIYFGVWQDRDLA